MNSAKEREASDCLIDERKKLKRTQQQMADIGKVSLRTQKGYEAGTSSPHAAYLKAIALAGADVQYILTGVRSGNAPDFEDKLAELQRVSRLVEKIAKVQNPQPDAYSLGPLRDLAYQAHLSDDQLAVIFDLLQLARQPEFWGEKKPLSRSRNKVTQVFHGDSNIKNLSSGDMTIHHDGRDDKEKK